MVKLTKSELRTQKKYRKNLKMLSKSKRVHNKAKRIANRNNSCDSCVYSRPDSGTCYYPHSALYIDVLDLDPCYEGVLRYLVENKEQSADKEVSQ